MIAKIALAVPVAALTVLTMAAGMVATSNGAAAGSNCIRQPGGGRHDIYCPSTPRPDRPNQQKR